MKPALLDTNVILRFLLNDHPTLSKQAKIIMQNHELHLDEVVIAENHLGAQLSIQKAQKGYFSNPHEHPESRKHQQPQKKDPIQSTKTLHTKKPSLRRLLAISPITRNKYPTSHPRQKPLQSSKIPLENQRVPYPSWLGKPQPSQSNIKDTQSNQLIRQHD